MSEATVDAGEEHGDGAGPGITGVAAAGRGVHGRRGPGPGLRGLDERGPPGRLGHLAAERLRGRGVLDAALRPLAVAVEAGLGAAALERRPVQLVVHHRLDAHQQHAQDHRERRDRRVRRQVPPLLITKIQHFENEHFFRGVEILFRPFFGNK